jgi:lipocalin
MRLIGVCANLPNKAKNMKIGILVFLAAMFIMPVSAQPQASQAAHYQKYKGAWFDIEYPAGWKERPASRSTTSVDGSDNAWFTSPDGSAQFYVFSPQWNGDPKEIALNAKREILVSHGVERASRGKMTGGGYLANNVAKWYTVRAKDHSYERSWIDLEDKGLNVRHVFGVKYRNAQTYRKYSAQYEHFRRSLEQFSD